MLDLLQRHLMEKQSEFVCQGINLAYIFKPFMNIY